MVVQSVVTSDFAALTELKAKAVKDAKGTAPEVAKQFEAIFLQSMLKSMRMGEHFLDESSPFRGKDQETFRDMLDAQYASNIASTKGIGLAAMLAKQLESVTGIEKETSVASEAASKSISAFHMDATERVTEPDKPETEVDEFVKSIWPKAKEAASLIGLDPKILMAQAALETGWGKFIIKDAEGASSNNLFNIKAGNSSEPEDSVTIKTTEYIADTPIKMNSAFRKYASVENSFNDYISLIKDSERYQGALAHTDNPEYYVNELHKAGYATDPAYSTKILAIYHGEELNQAIKKYEA